MEILGKEMTDEMPLVVDLDGTLVETDLLFEGIFTLLASAPVGALKILLSIARGRTALKKAVAEQVSLEPDHLPFNHNLLAFLQEQNRKGREIVLATAADRLYADAVSSYLGLFSNVIASDGIRNLRGRAKADLIGEILGGRPYIYVGNNTADLPCFDQASEVILVNPNRALKRRVKSENLHEGLLFERSWGLGTLLQALRVHQWAKNVLVFLPAMAGHEILNTEVLTPLTVAFVALSLMASSVYLLNDTFDLQADRRHPARCQRPLARGVLSIQSTLLMSTLLLLASLAVASLLPAMVWQLLICYVLSATAYTLYLKKLHLMDVFALVSFYVLRLLIGHESIGILYSYWFLMFCGFMFFSLALLKRHNESLLAEKGLQDHVPGRPYSRAEDSALAVIGISSGISAIVILVLYIQSDTVQVVYRNPYYLVAWCPIILFAFARSGVSTSFRYTLWVVASRLRNRNVRLRESCEWPPSRPTREFIAVAAFGRQLRESDALRSPTPRQSSNLGIRFLVDAFARPQHLVAT